MDQSVPSVTFGDSKGRNDHETTEVDLGKPGSVKWTVTSSELYAYRCSDKHQTEEVNSPQPGMCSGRLEGIGWEHRFRSFLLLRRAIPRGAVSHLYT